MPLDLILQQCAQEKDGTYCGNVQIVRQESQEVLKNFNFQVVEISELKPLLKITFERFVQKEKQKTKSNTNAQTIIDEIKAEVKQ